MFFSVISKNLKLEILTKNLVTFKRWDVWIHWKIWVLGGGGHEVGDFEKPTFSAAICLKRVEGAWTVCRFKGELDKKKVGCGVLGGCWYPNAHDKIQRFND